MGYLHKATWPYLHYHNAYGRKTYHRSDITQGALSHKFARPPNQLIMLGHLAN